MDAGALIFVGLILVLFGGVFRKMFDALGRWFEAPPPPPPEEPLFTVTVTIRTTERPAHADPVTGRKET